MLRTDETGEARKPSDYVFGNAVGQRIRSVDTAWRNACARAGIVGLHFHDLRREAGSRWLDAGVPLQVVRDWLGHSNVSQTSTYLATTADSTVRGDAEV
jgi:integrase